MAIVKMKRLRLVAMQEDREEILRVLQRMGCVEIGEPCVDWSDPLWAGLSRPDGGKLSDAKNRKNAGTFRTRAIRGWFMNMEGWQKGLLKK